ncbi:MAG: hypothetical protein ACD_77C00252G0006 [uncultured bacterium]|nr:MAG: hypothetical protein ACD_77C00252G0006 [uncultured bacterium]HBY02169.1 hypothetical protein [Rikenellaceae bacterium]
MIVKRLILISFFILTGLSLVGQSYLQRLSGIISDSDSKALLYGAVVVVETVNGKNFTETDSLGQFSIMIPPGRHTVKISFLGYNSHIIKDILVGTGKQIFLNINLTESTEQIEELIVSAESKRNINSMAAVSVHRLKSQDAARYAAGYFDPLRMVTAMPGVSAGNDDANNQIIIRGNSPKGLQWKLEGIEIPNPNHLTAGQGTSGGAYSAITTNALSGFDFYTAAFPAEIGNAFSGVMDLNLRNGNAIKGEYALGLSVVGAEVSAEGPIDKKSGSSWFGNFRYANFDFLKRYGLIDSDEIGIIPRSWDWAFKATVKTKKQGTFEFFSIGGSSLVGDIASDNADSIKNGADKDEFTSRHFVAVAGLKHFIAFPDSRTYLRTTVGYTYEQDHSDEYITDTLLNKNLYYEELYKYPAIRISTMLNHKFNSKNSLRLGFSLNSISGDMYARKFKTSGIYDTLIDTKATGWYNSYFAQWKYKPANFLEINTGLHTFHSGITQEFIWEPRLSMVFHLPQGQTLNIGSGIHSRLEPLSIYNYRVKINNNNRGTLNEDLKTIKALHFTLGFNRQFGTDFNMGFEIYLQSLFDVPISVAKTNLYSVLNASYGLPDINLKNEGKGINKGIEFTMEKDFTKNYYFMMSASLFDSKYRASNGNWYNTYFNNGHIFNFTGGKEFAIGKKRMNTFGFNIKALLRGGYRYTPVDVDLSLSRRRIIYDISRTYGKQLPAYQRIDLGFSYRLNQKKSSWTFLIDIQNITNRKNTINKRFSYVSGKIVERYSLSVGLVPVASIRVEF